MTAAALLALALAAAGHADHPGHAGAHADADLPAPAGVLVDHAPGEGEWMLGYRLLLGLQGGAIRRGARAPDDAAIVAGGCGAGPCYAVPSRMRMQMHMLDAMLGVAPGWALMVSPTLVTSDMSKRALDGAPPPDTFETNQLLFHHLSHPHAAGGVGDTGLFVLRTLTGGAARATLAFGLSVPTGTTALRYRRTHGIDGDVLPADMQTGSGTWDLLPRLSVRTGGRAFAAGAEAAATVRFAGWDPQGHVLGDELSLSTWIAAGLPAGLSLSARVLLLGRGATRGEQAGRRYILGPEDLSANSGGRFVDAGAGLAWAGSGAWAGHRVGVEWLQPVVDRPNGFQLRRRGTLAAVLGRAF